MIRSSALKALGVFLAIAGVTGSSLAAPAKSKKAPSASKALRDAYKALGKQKNFSVSLNVQGGISDRTDHGISEFAVRETYNASVYGNKVMHVPGMKAYRTSKKGVQYQLGAWKYITTSKKGTVMDRLFKFPLEAVADATKHSRSASWKAAAADEEKKSRKKRSSKKKRSKKSKKKGKTVVEDDEEDSAKFPGTIVVSAPPKEALKHFLKVENSGCLNGG
ncbi:MAG: hypothetical protein AAF517_04800 [Planctomycetota bacterium]